MNFEHTMRLQSNMYGSACENDQNEIKNEMRHIKGQTTLVYTEIDTEMSVIYYQITQIKPDLFMVDLSRSQVRQCSVCVCVNMMCE